MSHVSSSTNRSWAINDLWDAVLLLIAGWLYGSQQMAGLSDWELYNQSVAVLPRICLGSGLLLLLSGAINLTAFSWGAVLSRLCNTLVAIAFLLVGGIWLKNEDYFGLLPLLFGAMCLRTAWGRWLLPRAATSSRLPSGKQSQPNVLPRGDLKPDETAPEGFLAEMGRSHRQNQPDQQDTP